MSIIIDYLVIFPDDQFHQVNLRDPTGAPDGSVLISGA